ncbi:glycosyltransferase family 2 protein [Gloeocapsa sp. PCC 73106]|uniref:glycosyltransferase family 2 protein n=1 Tax=Gloeocapsa sp. PCC 73106 TaxID=102232 RepID=UPI0002ACF345|nr:glycosyltransferase family 2 protein [Gloeocapsa sp. PCC 73106]ELR96302.1 glycosyl transferase [Gloeocapsa sp. PCC 73106]
MQISVGIPFYNNQATLGAAIRSVFAQTWQDWELILVDDGSSDRSVEIAKAVEDSRVKVIQDGENRGLAWRLNQITRLAQGEYLARMDGDDLMHPQRLERQIEYLRQNPQVDVVATGVYVVNHENQLQGIRGLDSLHQMTTKSVLLNKGLIIHPTVMGKRDWFERYPYDTSYLRTQDRELWCRSAGDSCFAKIPEPLYFYRQSRLNPQNYLKTYRLASRQNLRLLQSYGIANLGVIETFKQMASIPVKIWTYQCLTWLGLQNKLMSQKNQSLSPQQQAEGVATLEYILTYPIPGL